LVSKGEIFYTVLLKVHSGNCLQKISILDHSLIKLLQNEQGCNFFSSQCIYLTYVTAFNNPTVRGYLLLANM